MESKVAQHRKKSMEETRTQAANDRRITGQHLYYLLKKQQFKCALSGVDLEPEDASLDHIVPFSRGGKHELSNLQIVHAAVNRMKGTLSQEEFIGWCNKIAAWRR